MLEMKRLIRNPSLWLALAAVVGIGAIAANSLLTRQRLATGTAPPPDSASREMVGQHRPAFELPDRDGIPHGVGEWDGRVLVVNFWASWCGPCRREMPAFARLQTAHGAEGLQFVGIAIDDVPEVQRFLEELDAPVNYPILVAQDAAIDVAKAYGNALGLLPYTVIVDRAGVIRDTRYGELAQEEAEALILPLL